jgi:hypothetical protein
MFRLAWKDLPRLIYTSVISPFKFSIIGTELGSTTKLIPQNLGQKAKLFNNIIPGVRLHRMWSMRHEEY